MPQKQQQQMIIGIAMMRARKIRQPMTIPTTSPTVRSAQIIGDKGIFDCMQVIMYSFRIIVIIIIIVIINSYADDAEYTEITAIHKIDYSYIVEPHSEPDQYTEP